MTGETSDSPPRGRVLTGALIGLGLGLFVCVPWGAFAGAGAPGMHLMLPLTVAFVLIGAWFAAVTSLSQGEPETTALDLGAIPPQPAAAGPERPEPQRQKTLV